MRYNYIRESLYVHQSPRIAVSEFSKHAVRGSNRQRCNWLMRPARADSLAPRPLAGGRREERKTEIVGGEAHAGGAVRADEDNECRRCERYVEEGLQCDACQKWFHYFICTIKGWVRRNARGSQIWVPQWSGFARGAKWSWTGWKK